MKAGDTSEVEKKVAVVRRLRALDIWRPVGLRGMRRKVAVVHHQRAHCLVQVYGLEAQL
jgi:hypothetical protein